MKKEDWEKAKSRLRAPLGQVDLLCDGYSVTLDPTAYAAIPNKAGIYGAAPAADKPAEIPANSEKAATSLLQNITVGPVSSGDAAAVVAVCKEHGTTADSYTNAENHLQIICIRSVVQAVADAVLAVCKERKLTDAKLYTSHWA